MVEGPLFLGQTSFPSERLLLLVPVSASTESFCLWSSAPSDFPIYVWAVSLPDFAPWNLLCTVSSKAELIGWGYCSVRRVVCLAHVRMCVWPLVPQNQMWWCTSVIFAVQRREAGGWGFQGHLDFVESLKLVCDPASDISWNDLLRTQITNFCFKTYCRVLQYFISNRFQSTQGGCHSLSRHPGPVCPMLITSLSVPTTTPRPPRSALPFFRNHMSTCFCRGSQSSTEFISSRSLQALMFTDLLWYIHVLCVLSHPTSLPFQMPCGLIRLLLSPTFHYLCAH